ncbi:MAG TPA: DPP IV N-terminal domain-containing protein [Candidatus Acidoferrum sp.]|nr:DPP IV N-terminal domain-containing protein [Candidatus Acidoferrum sp.]
MKSPRNNQILIRVYFAVLALSLSWAMGVSAQGTFTLEQVLSAPFNSELVAARSGDRIAWASNHEGKRNIWVAEGPEFKARQLTSYAQDDGGELSGLQFSADGNALVYVRGEGKDSAGDYANPTGNPAGEQQTVWSISWSGGTPTKVDAGNSPVISAQGRIVYARGGELWMASLKADEKPKQIVVRGKSHPVEWSSDGTRLLFVTDREDHSFVGIYDVNAQTVTFLSPSVDSDSSPVWSPDGKRVAFVRQPAVPRDTPDGYFIEPDRAHPWAIWVADLGTGQAKEIWKSGTTLQDSFPYMASNNAGGVLHWAADGRLVFASEMDGWQHLYSISVDGGAAKLLTPGDCEVEQWTFSADNKNIFLNSNCGDIDRRHLWTVGVDGGNLKQLTGEKSSGGV